MRCLFEYIPHLFQGGGVPCYILLNSLSSNQVVRVTAAGYVTQEANDGVMEGANSEITVLLIAVT